MYKYIQNLLFIYFKSYICKIILKFNTLYYKFKIFEIVTFEQKPIFKKAISYCIIIQK